MMTVDDVRSVLQNVRFRDWSFRVQPKGDGFLVFAVFTAPDSNTGVPSEQHSRKWYVSSHAVSSEIIQTAYAAVQRAILHEVAEDFLYRGLRIYNPHLDVEELVEVAERGKLQVRT